MENIFLGNKSIANYVMAKLNKYVNLFSSEELDNVDELMIDNRRIIADDESFSFDVISLFKNLKRLDLRYLSIDINDYNELFKLSKLEDLSLFDCFLENPSGLVSFSLKKLTIADCNIKNFSFLKLLNGLEELTIFGENIKVSCLKDLKLVKLDLSNSNVEADEVVDLSSLEELYITNSNIEDLSFLKNFNSLKIIDVDKKMAENNLELIKELKSKNVDVFIDGFIDSEGDTNEL